MPTVRDIQSLLHILRDVRPQWLPKPQRGAQAFSIGHKNLSLQMATALQKDLAVRELEAILGTYCPQLVTLERQAQYNKWDETHNGSHEDYQALLNLQLDIKLSPYCQKVLGLMSLAR